MFDEQAKLDKTVTEAYAPGRHNCTIAIIDDLESNRAFLEHLAWKQEGVHSVLTYNSALEALPSCLKTPPDLIITDFHMPGMNAVEFLEAFRASARVQDLPVVVISSRNEAENRRHALQAGATDFLMVPFDPLEFQARINNLLKLSIHQRNLRKQSVSLRSELQETKHRSQENTTRFTGIIDSVPALVFAVNDAGKCVFANQYCFEFLGVPSGHIGEAQSLADEVAAQRKQDGNCRLASAEEVTLTGQSGREYVFLILPKSIECCGRPEGLIVYSGIEITRLKQTEQSLRKAKDEAEAANRAKSAFLSHMTHEIRTPLNAIIGFTDLMCAEIYGPVGNTTYKTYLQDIQSSASHLLAILNEILDFSQIEAERHCVDLSEFTLHDCLRDVTNMIEPQIRRRKNSLTFHDIPDIHLHTDRRKLTQVVLNLLVNANQATDNGALCVSAAEIPDKRISLLVSDNGVGMDEDELTLAVTEFGRVTTPAFVSTGQVGTGLGLPISIRLAELLGGNLGIDTEKGAGTTVVVTIPQQFPPPAPHEETSVTDREMAAMAHSQGCLNP